MWHHGMITGAECDRRLGLQGLTNGTFLIRQRGNDFHLAVCADGKIVNYLIKSKKGVLSMGEQFPKFKSLEELVNHFSQHERTGMAERLSQACPLPAAAVQAASTSSADSGGKRVLSKAERAERKKRLLARRDREMKEQLANLEEFTPYWTKGTCYLMIALLVMEMWRSYEPGQPVAKVSFKPVTEIGTPPVGIGENRSETFEKVVPFNFLIGPTAADLIVYGAKYAPCMRSDTKIFAALAKQREAEFGTLGCCEVTVLNGISAGQTTAADCANLAGVWVQGGLCSEAGTDSKITLRPCCIANNGTCQITTEEYCEFFDGVWDTTRQKCGDTNCLANRCGLSMKAKNEPSQWFRLITSIFLHGGVLHLALNMYFQMSLGVQIERATGWLRMMLIYMIAGIGGNLTSAVFSPDIPSVGCSGALYGLLGVSFVDLLQSWRVVKDPWSKLGKTSLTAAGFLLVGTIPFIDNWAHVGGFFFGIVGAIIFLPFLTFGSWDSFKKKCLVFICIPLLIVMTFVLFMIFYEIQGTEFCKKCKYIQCIPWTTDFCAETPGWNED